MQFFRKKLNTQKAGLFVFGIVAVFLPVYLIIWVMERHTGGVFMYPYDDTFIHLSIADNLTKGTWGINNQQFASASSSVLYTIVLAFFRLFSQSVMVPFFVNLLAAAGILLSLHLWLQKHRIDNYTQAAVFLLASFFTPISLLVVSGMEHTLQCLFSFLFVFHFSDWLEENSKMRQRLPFKIFLFAVLVASIRYEGLFLVAIGCLLLMIFRRWFSAVLLGLVAVAPLVVFGVISVSNNNFFLPNSVLVKSGTLNTGVLHLFYDIFLERLVFPRNGLPALSTQRLLIIIPILLLVFKNVLKKSYFFILLFLFGATLLQLSFAATGYLYRYEAFLFFCFWVIFPVLFREYGKWTMAWLGSIVWKLTALALFFFLFFPAVLRSLTALQKAPQASVNIFDQQYQMSRFVLRNFNHAAVALNDIGAVSYYTDAAITDLWGLASPQVAKSRKGGYWTGAFLDSLCRSDSVQLAIIYDRWFDSSLIRRWTKVAEWEIRDNVICGDSVVSFYVLDPNNKNRVFADLKKYEASLPKTVRVRYY